MDDLQATPRLRYAVIGAAAGIFHSHRPALALPSVELVALADINEDAGQALAAELHCLFFRDYQVMLRESTPDVVVILTPPFLHATMTKAALQAGCHVLVEKPMAMQIAEADEMIAVAQSQQRLLGVIFQQRRRPEIVAARQWIQEGRLGQLQRAELTAVWTRPASYFALAPWRATWAGEGGGVVTNQASHNLDLLCYLLGSPSRVFAWTRNLLHHIETEDTIHALLAWPNGLLGSLHISTAEADEAERLKIVGTQGSLEIGHGRLLAHTLEMDVHDYARLQTHPYASLARTPQTITLPPGQADHVAVYRSFHAALLQQPSDYCDGFQARQELEVANAIVYSNYLHREVTLPLDPSAYRTLLSELQTP